MNENFAKTLFQQATKFILNDTNPSTLLYDLDLIANNITSLRSSFPKNSLHCFAIKSSPISKLVEYIKSCGMGVEVASLPELKHALSLGFESNQIIFDSPCKTMQEIEFALENKVYLNVDNFQELERIDKILKKLNVERRNIGIRVNPQMDAGEIQMTSTATKTSKFGIPFQYKEQLLDAYKKFEFLNGIHIHVGSQGCPISLIINNLKEVMKFINLVNEEKKKIQYIDIGGGLPINYEGDETKPTFEEYGELLKKEIPELFSGEYLIITEFGRAITGKSGTVISKVEYTKDIGHKHYAFIHVGADLFVRTAYMPSIWIHRISLFTKNGEYYSIKRKKECREGDRVQEIAGPLCFSGDLVAQNLEISPLINVDDFIIIHDAGAYTFGMWSRYNSRQAPSIYGYKRKNDEIEFILFKKEEEVEEVLKFWK